ncbi:MAG TPA: undecaprenyl-phosphate glucose phosphotransferase [Clostridia bacterium]|nr:undecaprenyl-phosphate glucose phosphotransferase [Clostridia bacterium]
MIRENQQLFNRLNLIIEMAVLEASVVVSYCVCYYAIAFASAPFTLAEISLYGLALLPIYFLVYSFFKTYAPLRSMTYSSIIKKTFSANSIVMIPVIIVLLAMQYFYSTWLLLVFYYLICLFMMILKRVLLKAIVNDLRKRGINCKTLIVTGSGKPAAEYLQAIKTKMSIGYQFIGYVSDGDTLEGERLGGYSELYDILNRYKPDELVCTLDTDNADRLQQIVSDCEKTGTRISIIPFCYQYLPSNAQIDQLGNIPLINLRQIPLDNNGKYFVKRVCDIAGSLTFLVLASPFMLIVALLIKCTSKGPVIFKQQRVGKDKKVFIMYKFRTMVQNSSEETGWTTKDDPRKTKFGSLLRKFSIDEWPQFFNVLKGDMSLVGPRPEIPFYVADFQKEIPRYMVKHQVKPGVTGLAQVKGWRGNTSIVNRVECDIYYIENWTLTLDLSILLRTVFVAFANNEKVVPKSNKNAIESKSCEALWTDGEDNKPKL